MTPPAVVTLEAFLARLYTDAELRARFLRDRADEARRAGLSSADQAAVLTMDATDLRLAARSFAHKRAKQRSAVSACRRFGWLPRWLTRR